MSLYILIAVLIYGIACGLVAVTVMVTYIACLDLNAWRGKDR